MLTKEPEKRPTTEELLKIPNISDFIRAAVGTVKHKLKKT